MTNEEWIELSSFVMIYTSISETCQGLLRKKINHIN